MDQNEMLAKITQANKRDVMQLLNFLNFEIEYILRPRSAPARYEHCITYVQTLDNLNTIVTISKVENLHTLNVMKTFIGELLVFTLTVVLKVLKEA